MAPSDTVIALEQINRSYQESTTSFLKKLDDLREILIQFRQAVKERAPPAIPDPASYYQPLPTRLQRVKKLGNTSDDGIRVTGNAPPLRGVKQAKKSFAWVSTRMYSLSSSKYKIPTQQQKLAGPVDQPRNNSLLYGQLPPAATDRVHYRWYIDTGQISQSKSSGATTV